MRWRPATLDHLLEAGGSAWRVSDDGCALELRVLEPVRTAVADAISSARAASADAAEHLDAAWRHAYGIDPDASAAYVEAVRAVESAARRLVQPNHLKATHGTINGELRAHPGRWQVAITETDGARLDATRVVDMMELVWHGHTDHHGANPTLPVTLDAARAAVHLAATLVQWWTSGAVVQIQTGRAERARH